MLSNRHHTARHRRIYNKGLRPLPPTPGHWRLMAKSKPGAETMPDAHAAGKAGTRRHRYTNNTASLQLAGVLLQLAYVLYSQRSTVLSEVTETTANLDFACASVLLASSNKRYTLKRLEASSEVRSNVAFCQTLLSELPRN